MGKYKVEDFEVGDTVYHLSNTTLKMVIINLYPDRSEIECRWITKAGEKLMDTFLAQELGKKSDLDPSISIISL